MTPERMEQVEAMLFDCIEEQIMDGHLISPKHFGVWAHNKGAIYVPIAESGMCAIGCALVYTTCNVDVGGYDAYRTKDAASLLGIDENDVYAIIAGFDGSTIRDGAFYDLGRRARQRYVGQ